MEQQAVPAEALAHEVTEVETVGEEGAEDVADLVVEATRAKRKNGSQ